MQINQLLEQGAALLAAAGVEEASRDAGLLLSHCLEYSRAQLYLHAASPVSEQQRVAYYELLQRRADREPYAYIVGEQEFFSLPFYVNGDVLIPRPETEFMLEKVFAYLAGNSKGRDVFHGTCLDLCCGSGAIAVVLAKELGCEVVALDISPAAVTMTKKNASRHNVALQVDCRLSDLFAALPAGVCFDVIVTNPPYVRRREIEEELAPEVARFEPHLALDGGVDGLDSIRRIAAHALEFMEHEAVLFMEIGWNQAGDVKEIFAGVSAGEMYYRNITVFQDYSGKERVFFAQAVRGGE